MMYRALAGARADLGLEHLALHDPSRDRLDRIHAVIRGMDMESASGLAVATTDLVDEALEGAAFVLCAVRVGGLQGRIIDETVPMSLGVLGQETVGPAGIAFALRTVPVMEAVAEAVARVAPEAWFLNFTNPAGLVTEAVREVLGDRAIGICDSPTTLCQGVARVLGRDPEDLWFDYFGLNHLGWLRAVRSAEGDLLAGLLADEDRLAGLPEAWALGTDCIRRIGMVPNEYLAYYLFTDRIQDAFERAGETRGQFLFAQQEEFYAGTDRSPRGALESWRRTRAQRDRTYMAEARGSPTGDPQTPSETTDPAQGDHLESGYAGIAVDYMRAAAGGARTVQILG